jgi:glycosyltransferase involved in cell wall biosynthesis
VKKVLIISYYWPPSGGAGVQRWLKFAKYLPGYGIEPYVLTVDPNYATYPQTDKSLEKDIPPGLKVYRTKSFEAMGIISRIFGKENIPYGGFSNVNKRGLFQTLLRFIRGNFFIPDARRGWNKYAFKKAVELIGRHEISTVITTGPPNSTHLVGLKLKKELEIKWLADFRDPWTDIYYYSDMLHTPIAKRIDRRMERQVLEKADRIICVNNSIRELLISKNRASDAGKFSVITNGFDEDDFKIPVTPSGDFVITYSGTISERYKPRIFFKALADLIKMYPDLLFRFRLAGNLSRGIEREIKDHGLNGIFENLGYVDHSKLQAILKSSSALLYIFPETLDYKGSSGKLFEYLAARRPVIAIDSAASDASAIIEECEAGKSFLREEESSLLEYLCQLVEKFRSEGEVRAGNDKYLNYSRKKLTATLAGLIKN